MSDLRDRLAAALRKHRVILALRVDDVSIKDTSDPHIAADAILAAFPDLERRYEIGAAVEELPLEVNVIERDPVDGKWCISGDGSLEDDWHDTLPAAIRAALEDER